MILLIVILIEIMKILKSCKSWFRLIIEISLIKVQDNNSDNPDSDIRKQLNTSTTKHLNN